METLEQKITRKRIERIEATAKQAALSQARLAEIEAQWAKEREDKLIAFTRACYDLLIGEQLSVEEVRGLITVCNENILEAKKNASI